MTRSLLLTCAASVAALGLFAGCESDDSLPTHPRTANFLTPDEKAQQNAEQRSLEKPAPALPINRTDLPGQSAVPVNPPVLTADVATPTSDTHILGYTGPSGWQAIGHTTGPMMAYTHDFYPGLMPHLPANPGTVPMTGSTPIPGGDFAVDYSWGQGLTLTDYPHRDWPVTTATYQTTHATQNPMYYFNLQQQLPVKQNNGTYCGDVTSGLIEIPWFYLNTLALPVLMVLEPPLATRTTGMPVLDPNLTGHLPEGKTAPAPFPGALKWNYPFLNPDGTVKQSGGNSSSTTTAPVAPM